MYTAAYMAGGSSVWGPQDELRCARENFAAAVAGMIRCEEVFSDRGAEGQQAARLDLFWIVAERADHLPEGIHPPAVDASQAGGD